MKAKLVVNYCSPCTWEAKAEENGVSHKVELHSRALLSHKNKANKSNINL